MILLIYFILNFFNFILMDVYLLKFSHKNFSLSKNRVALIVLYSSISAFCNYNYNLIINTLTYAVLILLFVLPFYHKERLASVVSSILLYLVLEFILLKVLFRCFFYMNYNNTLLNFQDIHFLILFFTIILTSHILQTVHTIRKNIKDSFIFSLLWITISSVVGIILYVIPIIMLMECRHLYFVLLYILDILGVFLYNAFTFIITAKIRQLTNKLHKYNDLLEKASAKKEYYEEVQSANQQLLRTKHDFHNKICGLLDLAETDNNKLLYQNLSKILGDFDEEEAQIYTHNPILNSILKVKSANLKKYNIATTYTITVPEKLNIDFRDMGILVGNLLDNAIEACLLIPEEQRKIDLTIDYRNTNLIIILKNCKIPHKNHSLCTTKKNAKEHGLGIKSVQHIVKKYNGIIEFTDNGHFFIASGILYHISSDSIKKQK